jgi:hypothetical protein
MVLGMSLETFTLLHVIISLIGITTGLVIAYGFLTNKRMDGLTHLFLETTALTSITGFMFPFHEVTPGIILGVISVAVLIPTYFARYAFKLAGSWRWIYVAGAVAALYFNVFVLIVQSFAKIPALHALAPTQKEPPFAITQGIMLAGFLVLGVLSVRRFHPVTAKAMAAHG